MGGENLNTGLLMLICAFIVQIGMNNHEVKILKMQIMTKI